MTCRSCGATIADKAIVCYRCGTATADPATLVPRHPAPPPARPAWIAVPLVLAIIAAAVWLVPKTPAGSPARWSAWAAVVVVTVIVVVAVRGRSRRRRRSG